MKHPVSGGAELPREFERPPGSGEPSWPGVDAEAVAAFERDGFLRVDGLVPLDEVDWLRAVFDWCYAGRHSGVPGGYFDLQRPYESEGLDLLPQVLHPEGVVPALTRTQAYANARRLAASLLCVVPDAVEGWGHMIEKTARVGGELPWHQDEAYWDPRLRYRALGIWIPLDAATVESGCMAFIPGSHRGDVVAHRHIGGDAAVHGLETVDPVEDAAAVAVPVEVGGATAHACRTLHRSFPNRADYARRAWANEFQLPPEKRERPVARPWVLETVDAWARRAR